MNVNSASMSNDILSIHNLHKSFGGTAILNNISLTVKQGDVICIVGSSGSGKSTFLRCLTRLEEPSSGKIFFEGTDITSQDTDINRVRQKMGMVFQHFNLFPHMNVLQNLILAPIKLQGRNIEEAKHLAMELLDCVGLSDRTLAYPSQLSGGQKQRVAIVRSLCMQPQVILFDEPTSALDPEMVGEVLSVIRRLAFNHMTMLIVTHEMGFAREIATRVLFMDQGRFLEDAAPGRFFSCPQNSRLQSFLSKIL